MSRRGDVPQPPHDRLARGRRINRHASRRPARITAWIALVAHLAFAAFPYALTGLLAPPVGVVVVYLYWAVLLGVWFWLLRARPAWSLAVPVAAVLGWILILSVGDMWFGWTA